MHECVFKTGTHTVADIFCQQCGNTLGWKYIKTSHKSQARPPASACALARHSPERGQT